jgi:hypothetical protein
MTLGSRQTGNTENYYGMRTEKLRIHSGTLARRTELQNAVAPVMAQVAHTRKQ